MHCHIHATIFWICSHDRYFILSKMMGNDYVDIYKSETIMNNLNPHWKGFTLPLQKLCNGNENLPLKLQVFDWDKHSDPDFVSITQIDL